MKNKLIFFLFLLTACSLLASAESGRTILPSPVGVEPVLVYQNPVAEITNNGLNIFGQAATIDCNPFSCVYEFEIENATLLEQSLKIEPYFNSQAEILKIESFETVSYSFAVPYCAATKQVGTDKNGDAQLECTEIKNQTATVEKKEFVPLQLSSERATVQLMNKSFSKNLTTITEQSSGAKRYRVTFKPTQKTGELVLKTYSTTDATIKASLDPWWQLSASLRFPIKITGSHEALDTNTTLTIRNIDTTTWNCGTANSRLVLVRQDTNAELDINPSGVCGVSSDMNIDFRMPIGLAANTDWNGTDTNGLMLYVNDTNRINPARNWNNVYLMGDNFDTNTISSYIHGEGSGGWTWNSAGYIVSGTDSWQSIGKSFGAVTKNIIVESRAMATGAGTATFNVMGNWNGLFSNSSSARASAYGINGNATYEQQPYVSSTKIGDYAVSKNEWYNLYIALVGTGDGNYVADILNTNTFLDGNASINSDLNYGFKQSNNTYFPTPSQNNYGLSGAGTNSNAYYDWIKMYKYTAQKPTITINPNTIPTLASVSVSAIIKGGSTLTVTPTGQAGVNIEAIHFYCNEIGTPTSANTLCSEGNASYAYPYNTTTCSYAVTGDANRIVYCRVYNDTNYSSQQTANYQVDSTAPTTTISYLQRTNQTTADVNLYCTDGTGSGCATTQYRLNSGAWQTYSGTFSISSSGTFTIDYNSTDVAGNLETTKTGTIYISPDTVVPTLTYSITKTYGFGVDSNIPFSFTCIVDRNDLIAYDLNVDGTMVVHRQDFNGTVDTNSVIISSSAPVFVFSCTNLSGLQASATVQPFQVLQFHLVNEADGTLLTQSNVDNNFAIVKVYSIDGNYSYDFKANHRGDVNAILPSSQMVFNYGYNDVLATQINRYIKTSIETQTPFRICAPFYQQFYEQQFVASSPRDIILYNNVGNCYEMMGSLAFLNANNYGLTTYTINRQYYLYLWDAGIKTLFSLIDGGTAQAYNIDIIQLTQIRANYPAGIDGLAVTPLINPITGNPDLNVLSIGYKSGDGNNTSVNIQISIDSNILYSQTFNDSNLANSFSINWNYTGIPGITEATFFTIQVTSQNPNGTKITKQVINSAGNAPTINQKIGNVQFYGGVPIIASVFAAIISSLFFLFGISIASTGRTFGVFGILVCLFCIALCALAVQIWYVDLLIAFYVITLFFLLLVGRPRQSYVLG